MAYFFEPHQNFWKKSDLYLRKAFTYLAYAVASCLDINFGTVAKCGQNLLEFKRESHSVMKTSGQFQGQYQRKFHEQFWSHSEIIDNKCTMSWTQTSSRIQQAISIASNLISKKINFALDSRFVKHEFKFQMRLQNKLAQTSISGQWQWVRHMETKRTKKVALIILWLLVAHSARQQKFFFSCTANKQK